MYIQSASSVSHQLSSTYEAGHHIAYRDSDRKPFGSSDGNVAEPRCGVIDASPAPSLESVHEHSAHPSTPSSPSPSTDGTNGNERRLLLAPFDKHMEIYIVNDRRMYVYYTFIILPVLHHCIAITIDHHACHCRTLQLCGRIYLFLMLMWSMHAYIIDTMCMVIM